MLERSFLAVVGALYWLLAAWCVARPHDTARAVGFTLSPGSGESEYLTVYGGLQVAIGALFLLPLLRSETTASALAACLIVHAALVVFRSLAFVRYAGIGTTTYWLAAGEWLVTLVSAALYYRGR